MKYFFRRKHEHSQEKNSDHKSIRDVYLINDEKLLKKIINAGEIDKFEKILPFRAGDVVQLTSTPPSEWNYYMEKKFLGKIVTLTFVSQSTIRFINDESFYFRACNVENVMGNH